MEDSSFRILSIDGGGIRGIVPASFLCELEDYLQRIKGQPVKLHEYFDLICGTSTGAIIAIGLALGMPAGEILQLYRDNASKIFGKQWWLPRFLKNIRRTVYAKHSNRSLEKILREAYAPYSADGDTRIGHAQTRLCVPAYLASHGRPTVFKTSHHQELHRDCHVPAYQAALSSSAAPTYFSAYDLEYNKKGGTQKVSLANLVDGGIFANNPALIGISEAMGLGHSIDKIKLLSLGTGTNTLKRPYSKTWLGTNKPWGIGYWMNPANGMPLIEMMMQGSSEIVNNTIKIMSNGMGNANTNIFRYDRLQTEFTAGTESVDLDSASPRQLGLLEGKGHELFKKHGTAVAATYCSTKRPVFTPCHPI